MSNDFDIFVVKMSILIYVFVVEDKSDERCVRGGSLTKRVD